MYFVALQIASPGTFLGTIFGFSIVWFWLGIFFIVLFLMRRFSTWKFIKKRVKVVLASGVSVFAVIAIVNLCLITHPRLSNGTEKVDYVILLGGGITKDARLTDSVQHRVEVCGEYVKNHPEAITVVTGGQGPFSPCPESDVLKPSLVACGVDENRILPEPKAKDTIQNFQYSVQVLSQATGKTVEEILHSPVAVVTSDFHIARAERLAKRMGFTNVYGVASKTPSLFVVNSYAREIFCYIKLNLRILLTKKPVSLASKVEDISSLE